MQARFQCHQLSLGFTLFLPPSTSLSKALPTSFYPENSSAAAYSLRLSPQIQTTCLLSLMKARLVRPRGPTLPPLRNWLQARVACSVPNSTSIRRTIQVHFFLACKTDLGGDPPQTPSFTIFSNGLFLAPFPAVDFICSWLLCRAERRSGRFFGFR